MAEPKKKIKSTYASLPVSHVQEGSHGEVSVTGDPFERLRTDHQRKVFEVAESIKLEEWDPKKLPKSFFVVFEGKRRTGKTTMCNWLLDYYKDNFSIAWCMTMTKKSGFWQKVVGDDFTFDGWYPGAIDKLIERNDKIIEKYGEDSDTSYKLASAIIILDDVISADIRRDPTMVRLAVEGRHHLISVVLLTQDPKAVFPIIRDNADVAVVFNLKTDRNKETIWMDFMNDVPKDVGYALVSKYCVEHDSLVCEQTNLNSNIQRNYFVSTGDKTKVTPYALGDAKQKAAVMAGWDREKKKKKMNALGVQPKENDDTMSLTIDKILRR